MRRIAFSTLIRRHARCALALAHNGYLIAVLGCSYRYTKMIVRRRHDNDRQGCFWVRMTEAHADPVCAGIIMPILREPLGGPPRL